MRSSIILTGEGVAVPADGSKWTDWDLDQLWEAADNIQLGGMALPDELLAEMSRQASYIAPVGYTVRYINYKGRLRTIVEKGSSNRTFE